MACKEASMEQKTTSLVARAKDLLLQQGIDSYLVGGYVRDALLGRATRDIDIAVVAKAPEVAQRLATALDGKYVLLDEANKVARVVLLEFGPIPGNRWNLDLSTIERDIETNLAHRDFTIDAMAVNLREWQEDRPPVNLIDPFQGKQDLEKRLIRAVSKTAFEDDPVRLLRAVRLAAEYGLTIEEGTEALIQSQSHLIRQAAGERVREELCHLLAAPDTAHSLRYLDQLDLLTAIFPELAQMKGVEQPYEHFWDVFDHSIETVAAVERLLKAGDSEYEDEILSAVPYILTLSQCFGEEVGGGISRGSLLKLAALLHDVAKPQTKTVDQNGRARFLGHTKEGTRIAGYILQRLRFSTREIRMTQKMVENHLRLWQMSSDGLLPTRRAIYRYFRDTGDVSIDTIFLTLADYLATYGPNLDLEDWRQCAQLIGYVLSQREKEESIVAPPKLIDGHDLINIFRMEPSRQIGELLEMVRESQAAGEITTREEALAFVRARLAQDKHHEE